MARPSTSSACAPPTSRSGKPATANAIAANWPQATNANARNTSTSRRSRASTAAPTANASAPSARCASPAVVRADRSQAATAQITSHSRNGAHGVRPVSSRCGALNANTTPAATAATVYV